MDASMTDAIFLIDIYGGLSRYTFITEHNQYFP